MSDLVEITSEVLLIASDSITNTTSFHGILRSKNIVSSVLVSICLAFMLIWYIQYLWKRRYLYYHSWNIPGPFSLPFIGSAHLFLSTTDDIMDVLIEQQKAYPDIARLWLGPKLFYAISRPEHIEKVLTSPKAIDKDNLYEFISVVVGDSLITTTGKKWKKHRKIIMPAFNQKILDKYQEIFVAKGTGLVNHLVRQAGNKELDLYSLISNCTLDIICETAVGLNMDIQNSNMEFAHNFDRMAEITAYRVFHIWHHLTFTWNWYPLSKEYAKCLKKFTDFTGTVVKRKLEEYNKKKLIKHSLPVIAEEYNAPKAIAFLDLILENSNFTEEELREEVDLFMIAGTDTTASAICCLFVMLGMFQDVQQKVLEEVLDIMGPDRIPLPSDLPEMKYTERVIKESLRLFPVAAFFARTIAEDIDAGDVIFPAGSSAYFGSVFIQRNETYWPDPLKFDPDRFLPENVAKRHPCTHIPFSFGPRNCIGGRYAMMNMKTILAIVIRKLKIFTAYKSVEEIKLKVNIVLRLKDGPQVWVERR